MKLNIDIETRSGEDIKNGVYKYVEDRDFAILLFAFSVDGGAVEIIDLANGETLPSELLNALTNSTVEKHAYNAQFERVCLSRYLGFPKTGILYADDKPYVKCTRHYIDPAGWHCTMAAASYAGIQGSLKQVAAYLDIDAQKDAAGTRLINKFSRPPFAEPAGADWEKFKAYCAQDVRVEMAVAEAVADFPMPPDEQALYELDQRINDRGVLIDLDFARRATEIAQDAAQEALDEVEMITRVENPRSVSQLKDWIARNSADGTPVDSLDAEAVEAMLGDSATPDTVKQVLKLRTQAAGSAVKKYDAMIACACKDGRVRGLMQYYGARTGRWAGRLVQVQNLPRNYDGTLEQAREFVAEGDDEALSMIYDVPDILKQLIRTALIPAPGSLFYVSDFSAIEARVIAWLAGEKWVLDVFSAGGDIYKEAAARMLGVSAEEVTKEERQKGKVATLALGYQGWTGALLAMGAVKMGIPEEELASIAGAWRNANPRIVKMWKLVERAMYRAWYDSAPVDYAGCIFRRRNSHMTIELPSGRALVYRDFQYTPAGGMSYNGTLLSGGVGRIETYGGKLTENIVQAIARDVLALAIKMIEKTGDRVVMHVHDEVVVEASYKCRGRIQAYMTTTPGWASGLPLDAETDVMSFYQK